LGVGLSNLNHLGVLKCSNRRSWVNAYRLTVGSGIVGALIRAKERGVDVRVIADKGAPCGRASGIDPLAAVGVPVWIDDRARLAHAKTMVIDGAVTLQGSYNWTRAARTWRAYPYRMSIRSR
jgi:phosphatidylserine/phosphatidylglycerophosphate/cardiolipin synthase-like enzyme